MKLPEIKLVDGFYFVNKTSAPVRVSHAGKGVYTVQPGGFITVEGWLPGEVKSFFDLKKAIRLGLLEQTTEVPSSSSSKRKKPRKSEDLGDGTESEPGSTG